jgi:hypothetical protein
MSPRVKIYVNKSFEVYLLDRPFLCAKDLFIKKICGRVEIVGRAETADEQKKWRVRLSCTLQSH